MKFKVINLLRTPERLYNFKKNNPNFLFEKFNAIDGNTINREDLVKNNLATPACAKRYTNGAIGVAMSHRELWKACVKDNVNYTILEDDAYLVPNFNQLVSTYTNSTKNWDFIFWGANFDQRLIVEFSPGIAAGEVKYNFDGITTNINLLKKQNLQPSLFRVHWAVGLMCYSITPKTAQYLLDVIFPLKDYFEWRDNYGIDNSIIEELANMNAMISLPPIALTLNDRYNSTVQVDNYGLGITVAKP